MDKTCDFKTVRGSARIFADDTFEFKPKSDGKPMKRVLYQNRASSLYETTGSVPKKVAHLVIDSNSADPLYDLYEQLDCLAKKMETAEKDAKKTDKTRRRPQGRRLLATEGLAVACTPSALTVCISIPLAQYH